MKEKKPSNPIVGGSSLITIFAVLCLITFTLLTLSTVTSSRNMAEDSYNAVKAYYNADLEAEKIFSDLKRGNVPSCVTVNGNLYTYVCTISETQFITVELMLIDGVWDVIKWCSGSSIH